MPRGIGFQPVIFRMGERPDFASQETSEVFGDFGSLAGRFPLAARLTDGDDQLSSSTLLASASNCCSISGSANRPRAYLAPSLSGCFQRQLL